MDRFVDVFKILKEFSFEIDEANKDYLCIICNKILSNAHSGPCGCRFCYDCISEFLNGEKKFCPGNTNECKQEMLNLNENIHYEPSINRKISKLIVKCPNKCEFKDEISKIENHIRVCNFQPIDCPYLNIGCNQYNLINNDMKNHLLFDIVPHSNLLLELIENMRNEMDLMKKDIGELKNENKSLKYENGSLKDEIEMIKLDIGENQTAISELERKGKINIEENIKLNEEVMMLKDEIERLKIDITNKNMNNTIEAIIMNVDEQTNNIDEIKFKLEMIENQQKNIINKINDIHIRNDQLMRKSFRLDEKVKKSINTQINDLQMKISEIRGEFEWKIDDFSKLEKEQLICSKLFYAFPNGYQMCLSVFVHHFASLFFVNDTLNVNLHLMRGEFDDNLVWPCKCDVSIDLINQNNNLTFKSEARKYKNRLKHSGWDKPKQKRNYIICFLSISLSDIKNLLINDQLLIKCRTNIPQ